VCHLFWVLFNQDVLALGIPSSVMRMPSYMSPDSHCMLAMTSTDFIMDVLLCERGRVIDADCIETYNLPLSLPIVVDDWSGFLSWVVSPYALRGMLVPSLIRALSVQATARVHRLSCAIHTTGLSYTRRRAGFLAGLVVSLSRPFNQPIGVASHETIVAKLALCMDIGSYLARRLDDESDSAVSSSVLEIYAGLLLEMGALQEVYMRQPAPLFVSRPILSFPGCVGPSALFKLSPAGDFENAPRFDTLPSPSAASAGAVGTDGHDKSASWQGRRDNGGAAGQGLPPEAFGLFRGHPSSGCSSYSDGGPVPVLLVDAGCSSSDDSSPASVGQGGVHIGADPAPFSYSASSADPAPFSYSGSSAGPAPCLHSIYIPCLPVATVAPAAAAAAPLAAAGSRRRHSVDDDCTLHGRLQRPARRVS